MSIRLRVLMAAGLALIAIGACTVQAAEMIRLPEGTLVRSLFTVEKAFRLEITVSDRAFDAPVTGDGAEYLFSDDDLCRGAAWRTWTHTDDGKEQAGVWRSLAHLCTTGETSVKFAVISDTQEFSSVHTTVAKTLAQVAAATPGVRFVLNAGDLVQEGTPAEWTEYRAIAEQYYTSRWPIVPVIGNHEYREDPHLTLRGTFCDAPSTALGWYAIDALNVSLVVLNSNTDVMPPAAVEEETRWLESALESRHGRTIVVTFHHPPYSSGMAVSQQPENPKFIRERWIPILRAHNVKLVINGHEHIYERLLDGSLNFLTAGAAGGKLTLPVFSKDPRSVFLSRYLRSVTVVEVMASGSIRLKTVSGSDGKPVEDVVLP